MQVLMFETNSTEPACAGARGKLNGLLLTPAKRMLASLNHGCFPHEGKRVRGRNNLTFIYNLVNGQGLKVNGQGLRVNGQGLRVNGQGASARFILSFNSFNL